MPLSPIAQPPLLAALPSRLWPLLVAPAALLPEWLQVVILGVVEGLTEFLPVSSTGHLVVTSELLRFQGSLGGTFEIFIQLGAVLAVVGYYAKDLWAQASAVLGRPGAPVEPATARRFWLHIVVACIPAVVIGLPLHDWIKAALFSSKVIAATLIGGGIVFIVVERLLRQAAPTGEVLHITTRQALWVGLAQTFALVPGVSRSGASIVGGMLAGLSRPTATAFSFYLAIPTLGGATIIDLLKSLELLTGDDVFRLALGTVVSLVVAWLSIGWLLRYVARSTFVAFGVYRIFAGAAIIALAMLGVL